VYTNPNINSILEKANLSFKLIVKSVIVNEVPSNIFKYYLTIEITLDKSLSFYTIFLNIINYFNWCTFLYYINIVKIIINKMKQFTLLAIIAITLLAATSCTEIQKGKKKVARKNAVRTQAGHVALATYLKVSVRTLLKRSSCRLAGATLTAVSRRVTVKAARRTVRQVARCAAALKRRRHAKRLRRAHRRASRVKGKRSKAVARRLRRARQRAARRSRAARKGKKTAKGRRRAVGNVLVALLRRLVATFLKL
jgi:hypothetical protein